MAIQDVPPESDRPATWGWLLAVGPPALALPFVALDLNFVTWLSAGLWIGGWWLAAMVLALKGKTMRPFFIANLALALLAVAAKPDLRLAIDEWRTRASRQAIAAALIRDPNAYPMGKWGVAPPGWPHGPVLYAGAAPDRHMLFVRTSPAYGWEGYLYAPSGDFQDCVGGNFIPIKQRLDAHWFWVWCSPT